MAKQTKPTNTPKPKTATGTAKKKKTEKRLTVDDLTHDIKAGEGYCQFGNKTLCK